MSGVCLCACLARMRTDAPWSLRLAVWQDSCLSGRKQLWRGRPEFLAHGRRRARRGRRCLTGFGRWRLLRKQQDHHGDHAQENAAANGNEGRARQAGSWRGSADGVRGSGSALWGRFAGVNGLGRRIEQGGWLRSSHRTFQGWLRSSHRTLQGWLLARQGNDRRVSFLHEWLE